MPRTRPRNSGTGCSRNSATRLSQPRNTVQPAVRLDMFLVQLVPEMHFLKEGQMRWLLVLAFAFFLATNSAAQTPTRWTLSAGPEWSSTLRTGHFYGGRLRAEYDLITPTSPFRLRLEAGGFWSPTQSYFGNRIDGSYYYGASQSVDLSCGL